jgi:hypothetical protein
VEFRDFHAAQGGDETRPRFRVRIKINGDRPRIIIVWDQFGIVFLSLVNILRRKPFGSAGRPAVWSRGFLDESSHDALFCSRVADFTKTPGNFVPYFPSLCDGFFVWVFLVVSDPQLLDFGGIHYSKRIRNYAAGKWHTTNEYFY